MDNPNNGFLLLKLAAFYIALYYMCVSGIIIFDPMMITNSMTWIVIGHRFAYSTMPHLGIENRVVYVMLFFFTQYFGLFMAFERLYAY